MDGMNKGQLEITLEQMTPATYSLMIDKLKN